VAQQRRRRKHRGTQAGTVRSGGRSRPRSRADARGSAEQRRQQKLNQPPTWRGALTRGGLAAGMLFLLLVVILKAPVADGVGLALIAGLIYTPSFHVIDSFMYRRRQARRAKRDESGAA
jgi:hypothetical protein